MSPIDREELKRTLIERLATDTQPAKKAPKPRSKTAKNQGIAVKGSHNAVVTGSHNVINFHPPAPRRSREAIVHPGRALATPEQRADVHELVRLVVERDNRTHQFVWQTVNGKVRVSKLDEMTPEQADRAVAYLRTWLARVSGAGVSTADVASLRKAFFAEAKKRFVDDTRRAELLTSWFNKPSLKDLTRDELEQAVRKIRALK